MKTPSPRSFPFVLGVASLALLPRFEAAAQTTVATAPVGYLQTSCLSASDTLVAPSFLRPAAFTGAVSSIATNSGAGTATITFSNASLTADAYDAPATTPPAKDTYYLRVGPATASLAGTVSVTQGSATVTGSGTTFGTDVKVGDRLTINDSYNLLTYSVVAIGSPTSLTLDRAFADSAAPTNSVSTVNKPAAARGTAVKSGAATNTTAAGSTLGGLSATYDHSPYEGRFYQVASNASGTVTVNLNGDTLTSVAAGTQVSIVPYWTLNSIFPASDVGVSFVATTSSRSTNTQVLVPNYSGSGTNLSSAATYVYYNDGSANVGWRKIGDLATDRGYEPMQPDGYFTVRNPASVATRQLTFSGSVPTTKLVTLLATNASTYQDNAVALNRPVDATIGTLGLNSTDGSFRATTSSRNTLDQLLVYDNGAASTNKSSSATYIYYNDGVSAPGWRKIGDLTTDKGSDPVSAASAFTIRKAPTTSAQTDVWTNLPNY